MKPLLRIVGGLLLCIVIAWLIGLAWFIREISVPVPPTDIQTDAVIVLSGEDGRVEHGILLLQQATAHKLFVSGLAPGAIPAALKKLETEQPQLYSCCVALGYDAVDLSGNARESKRWVSAEKLHTVRLVTADYNMPRALLAFRRTLASDVVVYPDPVSPQATRVHFGRHWSKVLRTVVREYDRYLAALVDTELAPVPATRPAG